MKGLLVAIMLLGMLPYAARADEADVAHCKRMATLDSHGANEGGTFGKIGQQDTERALARCESLAGIRHTAPPSSKARDPNDLHLAPDLTLVSARSAGTDGATKRKVFTCQYRDAANALHAYTVYDRCPKP